MATVTLRGLSKRYGKTRAVEGLDLTVDDGEFFVLLGPSGAGKTTTLGLIAGLEPPDAGEIYLDDDDVTRSNPWKRDVAMAFESYAALPAHVGFRQYRVSFAGPHPLAAALGAGDQG